MTIEMFKNFIGHISKWDQGEVDFHVLHPFDDIENLDNWLGGGCLGDDKWAKVIVTDNPEINQPTFVIERFETELPIPMYKLMVEFYNPFKRCLVSWGFSPQTCAIDAKKLIDDFFKECYRDGSETATFKEFVKHRINSMHGVADIKPNINKDYIKNADNWDYCLLTNTYSLSNLKFNDKIFNFCITTIPGQSASVLWESGKMLRTGTINQLMHEAAGYADRQTNKDDHLGEILRSNHEGKEKKKSEYHQVSKITKFVNLKPVRYEIELINDNDYVLLEDGDRIERTITVNDAWKAMEMHFKNRFMKEIQDLKNWKVGFGIVPSVKSYIWYFGESPMNKDSLQLVSREVEVKNTEIKNTIIHLYYGNDLIVYASDNIESALKMANNIACEVL